MKKLAAFLLVIFAIHSYAQDIIPNGGFENWAGFNVPAQWQTTNQFMPPGIFTIQKSDSAFEGNFAMEMETIDLDGMLVPGVATLGILEIGSTHGGIPFTARPLSLSGYVKHPSQGDEVMLYIEFLKNGSTIGSGFWSTTDSIGSYSLFQAPITFFSSEDPDTMNITILTDPFGPGSKLYIDGLKLNYPLTEISSKKENENLRIYPNPATNHITVSLEHAAVHSIRIIDMKEVEIKNIKVNEHEKMKINVENLPHGLYFLIIETDQTAIREKLIKY
ncbi:MAG: T9SS type A sorting domain-containing protein [Bacteroidetes bacterium]|nr:T9SS type A sorting domain-containing protein [Bacteroidota bacterium]